MLGNTPTGVGKTCWLLLCLMTVWKHPHGRGEDASGVLLAWVKVETPPRAWGRLTDNNETIPDKRNTPTGVGKTLSPLDFRR